MRAVYPDEDNPKLCRARETVWRNLSDSARAQFDDITPGVPIGDLPALLPGDGAAPGAGGEPSVIPLAPAPAEFAAPADIGTAPADTAAIPPASPNFVLLLLRPDAVDQLRLSRPQRRWLHTIPPGAPGLEPPGETAAAEDAAAAAAWKVQEVTP